MSSSSTPRRPVRPQPSTTAPPMIQPQPQQMTYQTYGQSPYAPQSQLASAYPQPHQHQPLLAPQPPASSPPSISRKRKAPGTIPTQGMSSMSGMSTGLGDPGGLNEQSEDIGEESAPGPAVPKKSRTNTPWTPAEEQRLKVLREGGNSWGEIAKTFPNRTEGSVKKHWYKDMHYAEFAEDDTAALLAAIKEYEASKWKVIGQKVGKPAKACEQHAKEHLQGRI